MPTDYDIVVTLCPECAWNNRNLRIIGALNEFEFVWHLLIESSMYPRNEVCGGSQWQPSLEIHLVNLSLYDHVRLCF